MEMTVCGQEWVSGVLRYSSSSLFRYIVGVISDMVLNQCQSGMDHDHLGQYRICFGNNFQFSTEYIYVREHVAFGLEWDQRNGNWWFPCLVRETAT